MHEPEPEDVRQQRYEGRLTEYNRVMEELGQAELAPKAHLLLQAVRDNIADAPETYDEHCRGLERPSAGTPGSLATHIITLRWWHRGNVIMEIAWPELREDAIGVAASFALGLSALPPLLDAPWPRRWFDAAGVETPGGGDEGMPTAHEVVAILDAVLDGRLVGTTDTPNAGATDCMPDIKEEGSRAGNLWVSLMRVLLPSDFRIVRKYTLGEQEHQEWLRTKWKARNASRRAATRPAFINRTVPLQRAPERRPSPERLHQA